MRERETGRKKVREKERERDLGRAWKKRRPNLLNVAYLEIWDINLAYFDIS